MKKETQNIFSKFQIFFAAVLSTTWARPDPKKYKSEVKDKTTNATLTDDERKFLREVEAKFGIKADVPVSTKNETGKVNGTNTAKAPFPAVIAIEIVNDTETNSKGKKRTIDANLGYGYRTNNGYTYTYFGKQPQEKGKFMIYPYSQEDIPPPHSSSYSSDRSHSSAGKYSASVEIQPSRAYELVDVKEEQNAYHYNKPTPSTNANYHNIKGLASPSPSYASAGHEETSSPQTHTSTLYTTYNGHDFSGLSGQFPMVMPNYLVEPSQLLKNPQYQNAGLSQDYIRNHHGSQLDQRVVPVLVLRIPSSYLKKPTAELYSNAPHNYPVSHYLNNVNLQEIVNSYFKKIGYSYAPPVMAYQDSAVSEPASTPAVAHMANYEPQHYATPYVQHPSYTQADYSGVQYSGVQPVMAKYPSTYTQQQYYVPQSQSYQQPEQQYEYTYQYVPQSEQMQAYYSQPQYQTQTEESAVHDGQSKYVTATHGASSGSPVDYSSQVVHETAAPAVEYGTPETRHASSASHYESSHSTSQEYGAHREQTVEYIPKSTAEHGPTKIYVPTYSTSQTMTQHTVPKETVAYYPSQSSSSLPNYSSSTGAQSYYYQKHEGDGSSGLVLTENYPSKDHTLATVLPLNYKRDKKPNTAAVQTVSYVTPMPSAKYQTHYKVMVPQTVLRNPATEKVAYVNSHSIPYTQVVHQEYNPEAEYTVSSHYVPPVGKQKAPSYPRNYHSHPKRNAKPDKQNNMSSFKKQKERNDNKKSA